LLFAPAYFQAFAAWTEQTYGWPHHLTITLNPNIVDVAALQGTVQRVCEKDGFLLSNPPKRGNDPDEETETQNHPGTAP